MGSNGEGSLSCMDCEQTEVKAEILDEHLHINIVSMAGNQCSPGPLQPQQSLLDLKKQIRSCWGIPVSQQVLLHDVNVIADDTQHLSVALGGGTEHTLTCVAKARTDKEQEDLDAELLIAAARGDRSQVVELLSEEAHLDPEWKDEESEEGLTPNALLLSIAAGDEEMATLLRKNGAKEPHLSPSTKSLPDAFEAGDLADVARHIAAGADVNVRLGRGQGIAATSSGTPLHACCAMHRQRGALEIAQVLVRRGADLAAGDGEGDTPLAHAKYFNARNVFDMLKDAGAMVDGPFYARRMVNANLQEHELEPVPRRNWRAMVMHLDDQPRQIDESSDTCESDVTSDADTDHEL
jgi:ankyrin repeat protein